MEHNYLNYFPELKNMPVAQQYILLEQADTRSFVGPAGM